MYEKPMLEKFGSFRDLTRYGGSKGWGGYGGNKGSNKDRS